MAIDDLDPRDQEVEAECARLKAAAAEEPGDDEDDVDDGGEETMFVRAYEAQTERLDVLLQFIGHYVPQADSFRQPAAGAEAGESGMQWADERITAGVREARNRLILGAIGAAQKILVGP